MNMAQIELQNLLTEGGEHVRIATLVYKKKGTLRGSGANRKRYGDHKVAVTILTGFDYKNVVAKSKDQILKIKDQDIVAHAHDYDLPDRNGELIKVNHVWEALTELHASFMRTIKGTNTSNTEKVFRPLKIEGEFLKGCRVYIGESKPDNPDAPKPGTIYLQGLKISEVIIEEAPNGDIPEPRSSPKSLAKRIIRSKLRIGRYVSYELSPEREFKLSLADVDHVLGIVK